MDTRNFEKYLADQYKYKKLPDEYSKKCQKIFIDNIPDFLAIDGYKMKCLHTINGTKFAYGYDRIVIGDYGAFVEIDPSDIISKDLLIVKPGQEYRINDPKYSNNVKYHWYTIDDSSDIKIYYQLKRVSYADYEPGKYYVSVHEVTY